MDKPELVLISKAQVSIFDPTVLVAYVDLVTDDRMHYNRDLLVLFRVDSQRDPRDSAMEAIKPVTQQMVEYINSRSDVKSYLELPVESLISASSIAFRRIVDSDGHFLAP